MSGKTPDPEKEQREQRAKVETISGSKKPAAR
jgi:hypothetical protein